MTLETYKPVACLLHQKLRDIQNQFTSTGIITLTRRKGVGILLLSNKVTISQY